MRKSIGKRTILEGGGIPRGEGEPRDSAETELKLNLREEDVRTSIGKCKNLGGVHRATSQKMSLDKASIWGMKIEGLQYENEGFWGAHRATSQYMSLD